MSETPEIIEAEIAALQAKLVEVQQETEIQIAELKIEEAALETAAITEPVETVIVAEPVIAVAAIQVPAPAPVAQHAAQPAVQTVPARWALQPLAR